MLFRSVFPQMGSHDIAVKVDITNPYTGNIMASHLGKHGRTSAYRRNICICRSVRFFTYGESDDSGYRKLFRQSYDTAYEYADKRTSFGYFQGCARKRIGIFKIFGDHKRNFQPFKSDILYKRDIHFPFQAL